MKEPAYSTLFQRRIMLAGFHGVMVILSVKLLEIVQWQRPSPPEPDHSPNGLAGMVPLTLNGEHVFVREAPVEFVPPLQLQYQAITQLPNPSVQKYKPNSMPETLGHEHTLV
jgi:hypothetical protein